MTFAERTSEILKQKGISNNELARMANLSSSGISTALRVDGNPRESTMLSICKALGMTIEEFWTSQRYNESLDPGEQRLLFIFDQLNAEGKEELLSQAEYYLTREKYRQEGSMSSVV